MRPARARSQRSRRSRSAHEVVGLYGDPDTSWGIAVDLGVRDLVTGSERPSGWPRCARRTRTSGAAPPSRSSARRTGPRDGPGWPPAPLRRREALLRVAVRDDGRRLAVGAHHGAVDGLGLVAVAGAAAGPAAAHRGPGASATAARRHGFVALEPAPAGRGPGRPAPAVRRRRRARRATRTSASVHPSAGRSAGPLTWRVAAARGLRRPARHARRPAAGRSARPGGRDACPQPDRQTAYLRLRVPVGAERGQVRRAIADRATRARLPRDVARGIGPRVTHLLRRRLGATALLSNLGLDRRGPSTRSRCSPPAAARARSRSGWRPRASTTTLSLRTRRADFTAAEHARAARRRVGDAASSADPLDGLSRGRTASRGRAAGPPAAAAAAAAP